MSLPIRTQTFRFDPAEQNIVSDDDLRAELKAAIEIREEAREDGDVITFMAQREYIASLQHRLERRADLKRN